jgi:hypothetical protein
MIACHGLNANYPHHTLLPARSHPPNTLHYQDQGYARSWMQTSENGRKRKFAHNLHKRANARYKEGTARGFLSPSVKPRTGYSGGTLAKMPSSIKVKFAEFFFYEVRE